MILGQSLVPSKCSINLNDGYYYYYYNCPPLTLQFIFSSLLFPKTFLPANPKMIPRESGILERRIRTANVNRALKIALAVVVLHLQQLEGGLSSG